MSSAYNILRCTLLAGFAFAQSFAQQGSLEGRVTNAQTGDAISGATIHLYPVFTRGARSSRRQAQTAASQADGGFRFDSLPPGTYFLSAERDGFVPVNQTQPSQQISVSAGQQVSNIAVQMNPQAIVRGKITDENGDPVPGARVEAFTTISLRGTAQLVRRSSAAANEAGEYKLTGLAAGTYYFAAQPDAEPKKTGKDEKATPPAAAPSPTPDADGAHIELVRTFYPKALEIENATALDLSAGQDLADTNIQVRRIATYRIRGKIETPLPNTPGQNLTISLAPRNSLPSEALGKIVHPNPDGTFEIQKVPPGSYTLSLTGADLSSLPQTHRTSSGTKLLARQDIDIAANDLSGVVLSAIPPITLTGRVVVDGPANAAFSRMHVRLTPSGNTAVGGNQDVTVNEDGTFAIDGLDPGQYVVRISGNPSGTYVKSVLFNRQDITTAALDVLQGGSGEIDIVLRSGAAEVDGTVQTPDQPSPPPTGTTAGNATLLVVLIPEELQPDGSGAYFGNAPPGGNFAILSVVPGRYYAFAIERWSPVWLNPDFLREMRTLSTPIDVAEYAHLQIQLQLTAADQIQQVVDRLGLTIGQGAIVRLP